MNPLIPRGPYRVIGDGQHPSNKRITSDSRPHIAKVYAQTLDPDPVADALANAFAALPDLIEAVEEMMGTLLSFDGLATDPTNPEGWSDADSYEAYMKGHAALAKANGEEQS